MSYNLDRLLARFLKYVQFDTGANESSETYPSSNNQLALGKALVEELRAIGLKDAVQTPFGVVYATIPASISDSRSEPVIGFCAHLDTSPDVPTGPVKPQVIRSYQIGDIALPADSSKKILVSENPELLCMEGMTIITADGTTLLGADDKTGVAILVELAAHLSEHLEIPHGKIRLCFTPDEEIGHGTDHIDLAEFGCDFCYTLDSSGVDGLDVETFSADAAAIRFTGNNIHPSIGKGRLINAIRAAGVFVDLLPFQGLSPETTDGREGFIHPVSLDATVESATLKLILRSFETSALTGYRDLLTDLVARIKQAFPGLKIDLSFTEQYRNMRDGLIKDPRAVDRAEAALRSLGRSAERQIVRGGTDGSRLTEMGLPTPNLTSGQHTPHSYLEWACLQEMAGTLDWTVAIVRVQ